MEGNKKGRYSPRQQLQPVLSPRSYAAHPKAATVVVRKESQIDLIKRRISALCVREEKLSHKAANNFTQLQQSLSVREESQQIRLLLEKQRAREAAQIKELRSGNLQTRMEQYYMSKQRKSQQQVQKSQNSQLVRSKSREIGTAIQRERQQRLQLKRQQQMKVHEQEVMARQERTRHQMRRRESVKSQRQR